MLKNEKILRMFIMESILNERGPEHISSNIKRKEPLEVHLDFLPPLAKIHPFLKFSDTAAVYNKVKERINIDDNYRSGPSQFVIDKTEDNIEEFIKIFKEANLDNTITFKDEDDERDDDSKNRSSVGFDTDYLRGTLSDDLPVILTTTIGDISGQFTAKIIDKSNLNTVSWAIHDLYHQFGESSQLTGKFKKGYPKFPHMLFSDRPRDFSKERDKLTKDHFKTVGVDSERKNIQKVGENIKEFFNEIGFTSGVGTFDIYPSVWAYIAMNIDEINLETIQELYDAGLSKDSIKFFIVMFGYVSKFKDWLANSKNKIFICLTHPTMA